MNPQPFDRTTVRRNRDRVAAKLGEHDFLIREVAERLADRLLDINRNFPLALDLGCHTGQLHEALKTGDKLSSLFQSDLSAVMACQASQNSNATFVQDEEWLCLAPASLDLVLSNLSLHWVNDLPGSLLQIRHALKPDGLFLATFFGGETLNELRICLQEAESKITGGLAPRLSPLIDIRDAGALLQRAGFSLPVADSERITLLYETPFALFKELRGLGEANALNQRLKSFSRREVFLETARIYSEKFMTSEGRIAATFDIITVTAWTPHESQQQPLRPGSGQQDLRQTLEHRENSEEN